jgi:hypothetical protein
MKLTPRYNVRRIRKQLDLWLWKRSMYLDAVKPVYNDHPRDPKIVAVVDRWSFFRGHLCNKRPNWELKIVAVVDRWPLFGGGR